MERALSYTTARKAAVQAGGNLGIFAKALAPLFGAVYTFEPDPALFKIMMSNAPEPNIVRFQAALGYDRKLIRTVMERLYKVQMPPHEGVTHVEPDGIIPTLRIDDLELPHVDLIYLDIEGQEFHALKGAEMSILLRRPVVAIEINQTCTHYGIDPDAIRAMVIGFGYKLAETIRNDEIYVPVER